MISSMISWGSESMTSCWLLEGLFRLLGAPGGDNSGLILSFSPANCPKSLDLRDRRVFMGDDDQMLWCHNCHNQSETMNITTLFTSTMSQGVTFPHCSDQAWQKPPFSKRLVFSSNVVCLQPVCHLSTLPPPRLHEHMSEPPLQPSNFSHNIVDVRTRRDHLGHKTLLTGASVGATSVLSRDGEGECGLLARRKASRWTRMIPYILPLVKHSPII